MPGDFQLEGLDYVAFIAYILMLCAVGFYAGRKTKGGSDDYFLAGRRLPWYVVGTSFVASNISTEHFIGMIGVALIFGIVPAAYEWGNIWSFSLLIWFFIPFLIASRVFTIPEYMERRYNWGLRQFFAVVTVISNVVAFLAAVLYGGGLALQSLFGWSLWTSIILLAIVAGSWAIYGGLKSVAWTDFLTLVFMLAGGIMVTFLGLYDLSGEAQSIVEGFRIMLERNRAESGIWAEAVAAVAPHIVKQAEYDRLALFQPVTHVLVPWPQLVVGFVSVSIWYNVCNQFMIQRVLGARNMYHARMGIVLAGYLKVLLPTIVVLPGLIMFAKHPEILLLPWQDVAPEADKAYVRSLQALVPNGRRGLFLGARFGARQSPLKTVGKAPPTIFTLDIYKRMLRPQSTERGLVIVGVVSSVVILTISIILAGFINRLGGSLFFYIQTLYAFFAPPFASVFLLGILFRWINAKGASAGVAVGFTFGILVKLYLQFGAAPPDWLQPFSIQAILNWAVCTTVCVIVSLLTERPQPEQVTDQLTINWRKINLFAELGGPWYRNVVFWWLLFVVLILSLALTFSGAFT